MAFVPDKALPFLLIGSFPFLPAALPRRLPIDIERRGTAFVAGIVVTLVQLLAGASGPILDVFYLHSRLGRYEILGTKAVTQTLGHLLKLGYYAYVIRMTATELPPWIYPAVIVASILGAAVGKRILRYVSDDQFRHVGRTIAFVIGVIYLGKGIFELTRPL